MSSDPILAAIEALAAKLSGRMDALEGEIGRLRGNFVEMLEAFERKLSVVREEIATPTHMANAAIDRAIDARREGDSVMSMVMSMNRQIARLRANFDGLKAEGA